MGQGSSAELSGRQEMSTFTPLGNRLAVSPQEAARDRVSHLQ